MYKTYRTYYCELFLRGTLKFSGVRYVPEFRYNRESGIRLIDCIEVFFLLKKYNQYFFRKKFSFVEPCFVCYSINTGGGGGRKNMISGNPLSLEKLQKLYIRYRITSNKAPLTFREPLHHRRDQSKKLSPPPGGSIRSSIHFLSILYLTLSSLLP